MPEEERWRRGQSRDRLLGTTLTQITEHGPSGVSGRSIARAAVPLGRPLGAWGLAKRPPAHLFTSSESFGTPVDWTITEPAWTLAARQANG